MLCSLIRAYPISKFLGKLCEPLWSIASIYTSNLLDLKLIEICFSSQRRASMFTGKQLQGSPISDKEIKGS
jgi:hypothetical protein